MSNSLLSNKSRPLVSSVVASQQPIAILVYHKIDQKPSRNLKFRGLTVTPGAFSRQMALLKMMGYQGLSMQQLMPYLTGEKAGKVVGITFDDGYQNNFVNALPVLAKHQFSATCYVPSALIGKENFWDSTKGLSPRFALMTKDEILAWNRAGCEIGSHGVDHQDLLKLTDTEAQKQIIQSKTTLENVLQKEVQHFCYPYGHFNEQHVAMVAQAGYRTATTTERSRVLENDKLLTLPRVPILLQTHALLFILKMITNREDRRRQKS